MVEENWANSADPLPPRTPLRRTQTSSVRCSTSPPSILTSASTAPSPPRRPAPRARHRPPGKLRRVRPHRLRPPPKAFPALYDFFAALLPPPHRPPPPEFDLTAFHAELDDIADALPVVREPPASRATLPPSSRRSSSRSTCTSTSASTRRPSPSSASPASSPASPASLRDDRLPPLLCRRPPRRHLRRPHRPLVALLAVHNAPRRLPPRRNPLLRPPRVARHLHRRAERRLREPPPRRCQRPQRPLFLSVALAIVAGANPVATQLENPHSAFARGARPAVLPAPTSERLLHKALLLVAHHHPRRKAPLRHLQWFFGEPCRSSLVLLQPALPRPTSRSRRCSSSNSSPSNTPRSCRRSSLSQRTTTSRYDGTIRPDGHYFVISFFLYRTEFLFDFS